MKKILDDVLKSIDKNSTTILTGVSIIGVVTTTVLGVRATVKAVDKLSETDEETRKTMSKLDIVRYVGKYYISTTVSGACTIGCIVASNHLSNKKMIALTSACKALETASVEYQKKVEEEIGVDSAKKIKEKIIEDRVKETYNSKEVIVLSGDRLYYDSISGRYFMSDDRTIGQCIDTLNVLLYNGESVTVNQLYEFIGLDDIIVGDKFGWESDDGLIELQIGSTVASDGRACLTIDFVNEPKLLRWA